MSRSETSNLVGGFLTNFGFTTFFLDFIFETYLSQTGHRFPDALKGLLFAHRINGVTVYLDQVQSLGTMLLPLTGIPLSLLGVVITPKAIIGRRAGKVRWKPIDPTVGYRTGSGLGVPAAIVVALFVGPFILRQIISHWV